MVKELAIDILRDLYRLYVEHPTATYSTGQIAYRQDVTEKQAQAALIYLKEKKWIHTYLEDGEWLQKITASGIDEILKTNLYPEHEPDEIDDNDIDLQPLNENFQGNMKVFISHKFEKENQKLALVLQKMLRAKNIYGYMAERKREYEFLIRDKIRKEIESSDYVIGIITKESLTSASVNQELGYALGKAKPVLLMVEKGVAQGVLTHGIEPEEFTREKFEIPCKNVIDYMVQKGNTNKKISDDELQELIVNVYEPCYNQMKNVYNERKCITNVPPDPWKSATSHRWKLKTESKMKELFEKYSVEREKWSRLWVEFGNSMQSQHHHLGLIASKAFNNSGLLNNATNIRLDERSSMETRDWIRAFDHIIVDVNTNNPETLYHDLLDYSIQTKNGHERWLEKWWNDNNGIYSNLLEIIPELKKNFNCSVSTQQLDEQREILKKTIEDLTLALEEKLK